MHLDSLCCLPAMNALFAALDGRILLLVSSDRFAGVAGFLREFRRNVARSGWRMTLALGFDIVALHIAAFFAPAMRLLAGRRSAWRSPRELAAAVGADVRSVADVNAAPMRDLLRRLQPDLVLCLHFDQILQPAFLKAAGCPVVNLHPALLPAHRGPCPAFWTLLARDPTCGVTIHLIVDRGIDSGPVVARRSRPLPPARCMGELDERLFGDAVALLLPLLGELPRRSPTAPDPSPKASPEARPETSPGAKPEAMPETTAETTPEAGLAVALAGDRAPSAPYEPFPDRAAVRRARRLGVRLWRLGQSARLIAGLFGWYRLDGEGVA